MSGGEAATGPAGRLARRVRGVGVPLPAECVSRCVGVPPPAERAAPPHLASPPRLPCGRFPVPETRKRG